MIAKDTTSTVNFYAMNTDGTPATGKTITATISINGATATAIADTITEIGDGWYKFNHSFNTAGNILIFFSCTGCVIPPWEDDVVQASGGGSSPSAADIALAVWSYEDENSATCPYRSIRYVKENSTYYVPLLSGYTSGYDILADYLWNFDPSTVLSTTSAAYRLVDIQDNAARPGDAMTLTAAYNAAKTAAQAGDAMTLTAAYNAAKTASQFNAATDTVTINSTQAATMVTASGFATPSDLAGLSTFDPSNDTVTINATQATSLASASDLDSVATKVELIKSKTDNLPTNPAATGDAMTLTAAYDAAKTASQFNASTDTVTINSTQAATMVTATGFATPSDIPTADITAIKTKVDTLHNTDLTGIATSANVTAAQTAIIAAMPTIPTDYAKASDLTGLSTFNAATDTVTINSTQAATMVTATGFATPANITTAQAAIIAHGDENWVGGGSGGGATAQQIWEYSNRTLTASPTDISTLATKTDLTTAVSGLSTFNAATDKVTIKDAQLEDIASDVWAHTLYLQNVGYTAGTILAGTMGLSDAILDATDTITTYGDNHWTTAVVPTNDITHIKNKVDTLHNTDLTGIATSTDITAAQAAILNAVPTAVWGDTTIYTGNSKGNKLSTIERLSQSMPGMIWMVDADYGASSEGTMGQAIYNMFNDHATSSEIAAVQAAIEDISIDTGDLAKSSEVAVLAELQKDLNAGVLNWSVTANALTIYNDNNTVRGTYTLTRDTDGNITRILPNS